MSTYVPQGRPDLPGRPPCANCGAAYRLHFAAAAPALVPEDTVPLGRGLCLTKRGRDRLEQAGALRCPEAYRPDTLEAARRELAEAERSGDEARVFVARGNLQRLEGRRNG